MFEWDETKNRTNIVKHGISFEEAIQIFDGPTMTFADDRFEYGEERSISIGITHAMVFIAVAHTDRDDITRIIMARRANRREREKYIDEIQP